MTQVKVKTLSEKRAEAKALKKVKKDRQTAENIRKQGELITERRKIDEMRKDYNAALVMATESPAERYARIENSVTILERDSVTLYDQMSKLRSANRWDTAEVKAALNPDAWELISLAIDEVIHFNEKSRTDFNAILERAKNGLVAIKDNYTENDLLSVEVDIVFDLRNKFGEWHETTLAKYVEIQQTIMNL